MTYEDDDGVVNVSHGGFRAYYCAYRARRPNGDGPHLQLPNYYQADTHCCGFLAALTVVRYLKLPATDSQVLGAIRPYVDCGADTEAMLAGLRKLGVTVRYRKDLDCAKLIGYLELGVPVILSVWPADWDSDHWTVLRGFSGGYGLDAMRVHLTNYQSLTLRRFRQEWSDMDTRGRGRAREGLVCST